MVLDLRDIPFYIINKQHDYEKRAVVENMLERLGFTYVVVPAINCEPDWISRSVTKLKILQMAEIETPFAILQDNVFFDHAIRMTYELPEETDALYLGQSSNGVEETGSQASYNNHFEVYNEQYLRLLNDLGGHAVVYISGRFRAASADGILEALLNTDFAYNAELEIALLQSKMLVLSPINNPVFLPGRRGNEQESTECALYDMAATSNFSDLLTPNQPKDFLMLEKGKKKFYLFFDIFVHWSLKKITAVAPHYGDDADFSAYHREVWLKVDDYLIRGTYIPCDLESYEPSIIIDFERPELEAIIAQRQVIHVEVICGQKSQSYELPKYVPGYDHTMSLVIRARMKWTDQFLRYYLDIMKLDHVYFYLSRLNNAGDKDKLIELFTPYVKRSKVTFIEWPYRWRNASDRKQISQPPQQTHALNKYGHGKWVGLFDLDEFLMLPGSSIPRFLEPYDPNRIGAVTFGLRWFFYKGPKSFNQIRNPLTEYIHCRKDEFGRKRQKLFASPKLARYARFHWVAEDLEEVQIDDADIFFHHYYFHEDRFIEGKDQPGIINRSLADLFLAHEAMENLESYVDDCLAKASAEESRVPESVFTLKGETGKRALHYYNNIGFRRREKILYAGDYNERILLSLLAKNFLEATFICPFNSGNETTIIAQIKGQVGASRIKVLNQQWHQVDPALLDDYDYFIYSGSTDYDRQYEVINFFYPQLRRAAVMIVDNWNEQAVRKGTRDALAKLDCKPRFERKIRTENVRNPHWGNGVGIFGLSKVKLPERPPAVSQIAYSRISQD